MDRILASALLIAGGYLAGSIPTAYLVSQWLRHLDLRDYGSGTVSGSMVYEHVSKWGIVPVGLFDIGKAALPAWVALELGFGVPVVLLAGLAAVVGHNWPLFLQFHGGRGLSTYAGLLVVLFPPGLLWLLGFLVAGWLLGDSAPFALAAMITLPVLANALGGSEAVFVAALAMVVITLIKRLEANRRPLPPPGAERRRVIVLRLFFDRDIADHTGWIRQVHSDGQDS
jgi:glycerol-3-phosphate acyltransferase PlsY